MPKTSFLDKLLNRINKIDTERIISIFSHISQQHGLLETIFNSLREGIIVTDEHLNVFFINDPALDLFQIPHDKYSDTSLSDFFSKIGFAEMAEEISTNPMQWLHRELEVNHPQKMFLRINTMPLFSNKGIFFGYIVFFTNISQDRKREQNSIKNEKLAIMNLIAASIAHEIGNPLNSIDIHLQLLERTIKKDDPTNQNNYLSSTSIIKAEIRRLERIVTNFLSAARPMKPTFRSSQINDVLRQIDDFMKPELKSLHIKTKLHLDKTIPESIFDKNLIKQALSNIIKNAFQAMPSGGTITLKTKNNKKNIQITISDTGIGMKPEFIKKIFEPYVTSKPDGVGLGLMISDRIISEHNGKISVKSIINQGTTFVVDLPLVLHRELKMIEGNKNE
ncbi:PAS domain-containing sensor histidine kinase [Chlamydiota bacterium]